MSKEVWRQYICLACGLIYDEKEGDPDSGLAPGTRFEDIPDDWECPLCGVTKSDFEPFEAVAVDGESCLVNQTGMGAVIIGAGIAGWAAASALRAQDKEMPITLVTGCSGDLYHKPELSLAVGRNRTSDDIVKESGLSAAKRLNVKLVSKTYVVGIDAHFRCVRTTRGTFKYKSLILAHGATPNIPEGIDKDHVVSINHLSGWQKMRARLGNGTANVGVVGAGMIGCELAEDLTKAGHKVTLIDQSSYPMSSLLPQIAGKKLKQHLVSLGVNYMSNDCVVLSTSCEEGVAVTLASGDTETFDLLVVAAGLRTSNRLARMASVDFDNGYSVNPCSLQTSDLSIFALGDCIAIDGRACRFIEPIQQQANRIAQTICGECPDIAMSLQPVIRLKTPALPVVIHGSPDSSLEWDVIEDTAHCMLLEQKKSGVTTARLELGKQNQTRAA